MLPFTQAPDTLALVPEDRSATTFALADGERRFGRIDVTRFPVLVAEAADGRWRFERRRGFLDQAVAVTPLHGAGAASEFDGAHVGRGGSLELGDTLYGFGVRGLLHERWRWRADGAVLGGVDERVQDGRRERTVVLTAAGRADPNLSLVLLLGVYLDGIFGKDSADSVRTFANPWTNPRVEITDSL